MDVYHAGHRLSVDEVHVRTIVTCMVDFLTIVYCSVRG